MPIIDHRPLSHQLIVRSVSTTIVNDEVTAVKVNLKSIGILAVDVVQYIIDNNLWQEILSKAGLAESLEQGTGTLVSEDDSQAPTYYYTVSFQIGSSA